MKAETKKRHTLKDVQELVKLAEKVGVTIPHKALIAALKGGK